MARSPSEQPTTPARLEGAAELLQIGEAAERTGLSIRTLRHWETVGLITPMARTPGGFRLYGREDLERVLVVKSMKPMGFQLEQMAELLALVESATRAVEEERAPGRDVVEPLRAYRDLAIDRIRRIARDMSDATDLLSRIESCIDGAHRVLEMPPAEPARNRV